MNRLRNYQYTIFALLSSVVLLGGLVLPGYILTLDMVFGPQVVWPVDGDILNGLPLLGLRFVLVAVFGGWMAQKLLLVTIFFLLFYLPLRYFGRIFKLERTYGAEYVVALLFAVNPFVYERFLSGQWLVVFGYALVMPLLAYAVAFFREQSVKSTLKLAVCFLLVGAVSIHTFMIAGLLFALSGFVVLVSQPKRLLLLSRGGLLAFLLLLGSSYWLVPALQGEATTVASFDANHWEVFATVGEGQVGALLNVVTMQGFWLEGQPWVERFVMPDDLGVVFHLAFIAMALFCLYGLVRAIRVQGLRLTTVLFVALAILSIIFSVGVGEGVFRGFNRWLFENVSFWKGFRDTQKWSMVLMTFYALFAGYGVQQILSRVWVAPYRRVVLFCALALPLIMTPMMFFGFNGQLSAVDYPDSWYQINEQLKVVPDCKAVFLPWHLYYILEFNNDLLTANPARAFFDCDITSSRDMGLGEASSEAGLSDEYFEIERLVTSDDVGMDEVVAGLKKIGITHIIYTEDLVDTLDDEYLYLFLASKMLNYELIEQGVYKFTVI